MAAKNTLLSRLQDHFRVGFEQGKDDLVQFVAIARHIFALLPADNVAGGPNPGTRVALRDR
jgi:hypothetical protein